VKNMTRKIFDGLIFLSYSSFLKMELVAKMFNQETYGLICEAPFLPGGIAEN
jgi:hypothetical protein